MVETMEICKWKSYECSFNAKRKLFHPFSYDRDEETESETKIRMPQDEYDNMESAGNETSKEKLFTTFFSVDTFDFNLIIIIQHEMKLL